MEFWAQKVLLTSLSLSLTTYPMKAGRRSQLCKNGFEKRARLFGLLEVPADGSSR
jgi:hypothetical protein